MPLPDMTALMRDETAVDDVFRLRCSPSAPFLLQHHPNAWEIAEEGLEGPTWVPVLSPRRLVPGANGVRTVKRGEGKEEAFRKAIDKDERQGYRTLPMDLTVSAEHLPEGVPAGRYIRSLDCIDPRTRVEGKIHVEAWDVPMDAPAGQRHTFRFDRASYNKWRAHLVESGVIPAPLEAVRVKLLRKHDARVLSAEVEPLPDEVRKRRVKEKAEKRDKVKAAKVPKAKKPRAVKS